MKLFVLSKENLAWSRAEAEQLHGRRGTLVGNLLFLDVEEWKGGLAFTRSIHDVLFETQGKVAFPWHIAVEPPFAVEGPGAAEVASLVWRGLERAGVEPSVDLTTPKTRITLFRVGEKLLVTKKLWTNKERFFDRRPHLRPRNHPTGLHPKLARAMINLAGPGVSVLDPFCGAGGLLLEGALAGRSMTGMDIDPEQVQRAKENLAFYGVKANLMVGDATRCDLLGRFDAIVTDLPLGRNAKLAAVEETFRGFFAAAARITEVLVVGAEKSCDLTPFFREWWAATASFDWYLHRSLTKQIFLLRT